MFYGGRRRSITWGREGDSPTVAKMMTNEKVRAHMTAPHSMKQMHTRHIVFQVEQTWPALHADASLLQMHHQGLHGGVLSCVLNFDVPCSRNLLLYFSENGDRHTRIGCSATRLDVAHFT